MRKRIGICAEINEVFYESMEYASRVIGCDAKTIKHRCLSDKFPNYEIVPFRVIYTEKKCVGCGKIKLLKEFYNQNTSKDKYMSTCKECRKKRRKKWRKDNPEKTREERKKYTSQPKAKAKRNKKLKEKRKTNTAFKVNLIMGSAVSRSLKGKKNGASWESLVGYNCEELMAHLEKQFTDGMSWDNYGKGKYKWNIDHVIARSKFDIVSAECKEFKDCWALNNLQPLWAVRNIEKGDRPMEPKYLIKPYYIK